MDRTIDPKQLADGKVLLSLKHQFITAQTHENLMPVLNCLRDSKVIVPLRAELNEEDTARLKNAQKGEKVSISHDVPVRPDILVNGGKKYLPVFSNPAQVPREYGENFSLGEIPFLTCVEMAQKFPDVSGIVLDAFTEAMILENKNAEMISKFKSRLSNAGDAQ